MYEQRQLYCDKCDTLTEHVLRGAYWYCTNTHSQPLRFCSGRIHNIYEIVNTHNPWNAHV